MTNRLLFISCCLLACWPNLAAFAQKSPNQEKVAKKKDLKGLKAWDRNGDGLLQRDEIPQKLRPQMAEWAKNMDLNPKKPLPLDVLLQAKSAKTKKQEGKKEQKSSRLDDETSRQSERKVAGFGGRSRNAKSDDRETDGSEGKELGKDSAKNDGKLSKAEQRQKRHFERLARSLLYQNDKNKNGRLERSEWSRLKGKPGNSDMNKDGVLTVDELAGHLQGYGSRESNLGDDSTVRSRRVRVSSNRERTGKSYRALTPHERLPEGLPDWFFEKDENFDGQISMREFEPEMSTATVEKFRRLDLNRDGFIVAKEYLQATD